MGKLDAFFIQYDNPSSVYYGGQRVSGRVVLVLNDTMKMRNILLEMRGRAKTRWTETRTTGTGKNRRSHTITYYDEEYYLTSNVILFPVGGAPEGDSIKMVAGTHEFRFSFPLPENCPTSFEGTYGFIRYFTKVVIDRPWKYDHATKAPFSVISLVDLNADPLAATAFTTTSSKTLGTLCCKAGQVHCDVMLDRRGYVPGEKLALKVRVNNESSRLIKNVAAELVQSVSFSAARHGSGFRKDRHSIRKVAVAESHEDLKAGKLREYDFSQTFVIPPIPPYMTTCRLIQIGYLLKITLDPSGPSFDIDVSVPITIGSVPLRQMFTAVQPSAPSASGGQPMPAPPHQNQYPGLPPPSYESCAFGETNIKDDDDNEHTGGNMNFAPKYPVYGFSSAPQQ